MNRDTRVFFDASVLVSAAYSLKGGSSRVIRLCELGGLAAVTSILVLNEAERNLREDFPSESLQRLNSFLQTAPWIVLDLPSAQAVAECQRLIDADDAHVLASALAGQVSYLLTLDRKHFFTNRLSQAHLPFVICTPGEFIQQYLPQHEDYPLPA